MFFKNIKIYRIADSATTQFCKILNARFYMLVNIGTYTSDNILYVALAWGFEAWEMSITMHTGPCPHHHLSQIFNSNAKHSFVLRLCWIVLSFSYFVINPFSSYPWYILRDAGDMLAPPISTIELKPVLSFELFLVPVCNSIAEMVSASMSPTSPKVYQG